MIKHLITYSNNLDTFRTTARAKVDEHEELLISEEDNLVLNIPSIVHYNTEGNVTHSISMLAYDDSAENIAFLESLGLDILAIGDTRDETSTNPYKTIFRSSIKKGKYDLAYPLKMGVDIDGNETGLLPRHAFGVFDLREIT